MRSERVPMRHTGGTPGGVTLRMLSGHDEMAIDGVDTRAAVALLGRVLADNGVTAASRLCASDRDALLAALHRQCWSDHVVATVTCARCAKPFDLSFELSALQAAIDADRAPTSLRIPTADDELDAAAFGPRHGVERLAASCGASPDGIPDAARALERAAPILDLDLRARCPECDCEQTTHFDLQSFVMQRLINEREVLLAEVHLLAATYGWSLNEILSLSRDARRMFTRLVSDAQSRATTGQGRRR